MKKKKTFKNAGSLQISMSKTSNGKITKNRSKFLKIKMEFSS